jgi:signal transduction histidine kinase
MSPTRPLFRALLVEDSPTDARLVQSIAARAPTVQFEMAWVQTLQDALTRLALGDIDLVFLDLTLPDSGPEETVERIRREVPGVPVIVWTSMDSPEFAAKAIQAGAQDYVPKGRIDPEILERTARYAVERQRVRTALERSYQELDEFAHIVSHDLKAPLRGIHNLAQIVKEDLGRNVPANVAENLDRLSDRALRLSQMIDGVLAYARRVRVRESPTEFAVRDVIDDVTDALRVPAAFKIVQNGTLPVMRSDRVRLQEVFQNLIGNAVKHHDRPVGTITVSVEDLAKQYEFRVEDDGPGIPKHEQGHLFDLFHPPSLRARPDSTHVGLAIVKKIVESHGGTISVEPVEPHGARFRFTWPKDAGAFSDLEPLRPPSPPR